MSYRQIIFLVLLLATGLAAPAWAGHTTGLVFAEEDRYRSIPLATPPLMGELPDRADLSKYFPTPGDQGDQASCVGWATAYAVKTYQEGVERGWNINSASHRFSPAFVYNQLAYPPGNRYGGSSFIDAFNILTEQGVVSLSDFPYNESDCSKQPSASVKSGANPYRIATWRRVNVMDTTEMKAQIASGFPVMLGIMVDDNFENLGADEIYTYYSGYSSGGHALVAVGFDDDKQAFLIYNSWGTGWADNGLGWVSYDAVKAISVEGYVCQDLIINAPDDITDTTEEPEYPTTKVDDEDYYDPDIYTPSESYPFAEIEAGRVDFDVTTPHGVGMVVTLSGGIYNCYGGAGQVLLEFTFDDGSPLYANDAQFSDIYGCVSAYTVVFQIPDNEFDISGTQLYMPYWALNMAPGYHSLAVTPYVYVNNFSVSAGQSYYFYYQQY